MASQAATGCSSPSGVPGRGFKKLSGTSVGIELLELEEELDPLLVGLAHADERAAAQLHAVVAHQPAGLLALLPGVGGDHLREERPRRLEVVVVAVDAALGEAAGLVVGEQPGADRHVEAGPVADHGHQLEDPGHGALVRTAHGQDDAELRGPGRLGLLGRPQHLVGVEEGGGLDRAVEPGRLGAEVAVLGAAAGLGRQDALDLDLGPAPVQPDLVGERGQRGDPRVGQLGQRGELLAGQQTALVEQGGLGRGSRARAVGESISGRAGSACRRARLGAERVTVVRMGVAAGSPGMPLR